MARTTLYRLCFVLPLLCAGCGTQSWLTHTERGVLFRGFDTLAREDEQVNVSAKLQFGDYLQPQANYLVTFYFDGKPAGQARTDENGIAEIAFVPEEPGLFNFEARLEAQEIGLEKPPAATVLVCCPEKNRELMVVDLDKTLVASGFSTVLLGDPMPVPDSVRILNKFAQRFTLIYLTHRPDLFAASSKDWLRKHGYPPGPLLLSSLSSFFEGSEKYKTGRLSRLKKEFPNLTLGIGDKFSDARAYAANGMAAYLILRVEENQKSAYYSSIIEEIKALPPPVEVVSGWKEIDECFFQKRKHPRGEIIDMLRKSASTAGSARGFQ